MGKTWNHCKIQWGSKHRMCFFNQPFYYLDSHLKCPPIYCWWIRNLAITSWYGENLPLFTRFYTSKQWLFGISEPSVCMLPHPIAENLRCIHTLKGHHTEIVCVAFNVQARRITGWWQLKDFLFSPLKIPNLTHIFQLGWFNHQLDNLVLELGFSPGDVPENWRQMMVATRWAGPQTSCKWGWNFTLLYRGPTTTCTTGRWVRTWVISLTSNIQHPPDFVTFLGDRGS